MGEFVVRLPVDIPRMQVRFEGRTYDLVPVIHRMLLSTDEMAASLVWHGGWPTPRYLTDRMPRWKEEVPPMEGIDVFVDGIAVAPMV